MASAHPFEGSAQPIVLGNDRVRDRGGGGRKEWRPDPIAAVAVGYRCRPVSSGPRKRGRPIARDGRGDKPACKREGRILLKVSNVATPHGGIRVPGRGLAVKQC